MARVRRAFAALTLIGRCGCLFLANFYKISHLIWFVNHFFHLFQIFVFFGFDPTNPVIHVPLRLKTKAIAFQIQTVRRLPKRSDWIVLPRRCPSLNCVFNSFKNIILFLSCPYCVSFVSSDLYIIAHLDGFVNRFFSFLSLPVHPFCAPLTSKYSHPSKGRTEPML